jgi:hypothetical protein
LNLSQSIPKYQARGKSVLTYAEYQGVGSKGLQLFRINNMKAQQQKAYSGYLTAGAKKRLTRAIFILCSMVKRRLVVNPCTGRLHHHHLSFITLTVAGGNTLLTGKEGYSKLLGPFLQWLRRSKDVNTYIWKAELQENGQLHYHITLPNLIHHREIRAKWNELQREAGLLEAHYKKFKNWSPPGTEITSVHSKDDMASYMIKEIAKTIQNRSTIGGKVWDCSANLSKADYFSDELTQFQYEFLEAAVKEGFAKKIEHPENRFCLYRFEEDVTDIILIDTQKERYRAWIDKWEMEININTS